MTKRYYIVLKGRVQNVGLRWTAQRIATELGLTGWIRNLDNGDVDLEIQGPPEKVMDFLNQLRHQKNWIRIEDFTMRQIAVSSEDKGKFVPKNYY